MSAPDHDHDALELDPVSTRIRHPGYVQIPTGVFVERFDVNISPLPAISFYFFPDEADASPRLIREANQPFSALALAAYETIWILERDFPMIRKRIESVLTNPKLTADLPAERKMEALQRAASVVVDDLFVNPSAENITRGVKVVSSFVRELVKEPKSYLMLSKLSEHDPYTLQHSIGCSVNCIILARKIGIHNEAELLEVGLAGLLHDIGKVKVNTAIINKPGALDDLEWKEMKQHSQHGYDIVRASPSLSDRTKYAILDHHEERDGRGYPRGLKAPEIHVFSKIVGICDIFNALTTNRSYSDARSPFDAFQLMREKLTHKFDDKLFKNLVLIYGGVID
jgi:HD-GYP domain-containing protein (c-di-GMP phosphodiesterase class II)